MASKRRLKRKLCLRKVAHLDLLSAKRASWKMNKKQDSWRNRITPYKCGLCGKYHIGHTPST